MSRSAGTLAADITKVRLVSSHNQRSNTVADNTTHNIDPRIDLTNPTLVPIMEAMQGLEAPLRSSGLEPAVRSLIKTRASQINGCAYCIDMHTKDARAHGETEQ